MAREKYLPDQPEDRVLGCCWEEVLTTLALPTDDAATDHCGTCTRASTPARPGRLLNLIDSMPESAISYLTIEHRARNRRDAATANRRLALRVATFARTFCPHNRRRL